MALLGLAKVWRKRGEADKAIQFARKCREIARSLHDDRLCELVAVSWPELGDDGPGDN